MSKTAKKDKLREHRKRWRLFGIVGWVTQIALILFCMLEVVYIIHLRVVSSADTTLPPVVLQDPGTGILVDIGGFHSADVIPAIIFGLMNYVVASYVAGLGAQRYWFMDAPSAAVERDAERAKIENETF